MMTVWPSYVVWVASFLWLVVLLIKPIVYPKYQNQKISKIDMFVFIISAITLLSFSYTSIKFTIDFAQDNLSREWLDFLLNLWGSLFVINLVCMIMAWVKLFRPTNPSSHTNWFFVFTTTLGVGHILALGSYVWILNIIFLAKSFLLKKFLLKKYLFNKNIHSIQLTAKGDLWTTH